MDTTNAIDHMFVYFANVEDPRRPHPTTFHALEAILIITIPGTICGAQNWVEIEQWGQAQQAWLSEFLALPELLALLDLILVVDKLCCSATQQALIAMGAFGT
jgi:hypothetical protein